jgi:hypothetical protein
MHTRAMGAVSEESRRVRERRQAARGKLERKLERDAAFGGYARAVAEQAAARSVVERSGGP